MERKQKIIDVPMEHERRFLVPNLNLMPVPFYLCRMVYIIQGYLEDEERTRLRDELSGIAHEYIRTNKTGSGISRIEIEKQMSAKNFWTMWKEVQCSLTKSRYFLPFGDTTVELNIFHGQLAGYMQYEVEFKSTEEALAFITPEWFGKEVTNDERHGNFSLAKNGIPKSL